MTPREVIKHNLRCSGAERIGFGFGGGRRNDFHGAGLGPPPTWKQRKWVEGNREFHDDEWGNVWHRIVGMSAGGEIYKPVLDDWAKLKDYQLPDLADPARFKPTAESFAKAGDRYRVAGVPGFPFAICRYMRRMEVYFQDLLLNRDKIDELHERVTALLEKLIAGYAVAGADGIFFCEDWGIQDRLLISPRMWREIFKPIFARLCGCAHKNGLDVLMHSCGYNWDILDDLAEVGVNAFQFDQPAIYGIERLAAKLRGLKVCLYSGVDIQKVLPTGDRALIVAEGKRMVRLFGQENGGFIARNYGDLKGIGVQPEWDQWAYDAIVEAAGLA